LDIAVSALQNGCDVTYHDMRIVSERPLYVGSRRFSTRQLRTPVFEDLLVNCNTLPTSSVVVRRELLLRAGGFSEDRAIIAGEDYDLWIRLSRLTERFTRLDGT